MKENSIILSDAFTNLAQFHVRENCIHLFLSQTVKLESVIIHLLIIPGKREVITLRTNDLPPESIVGFVTCLCDGKWWLACVLEIIQEDSQVKLTFLHPHGSSSSYKYPGTQDIRTVPMDNILTLVDPRTRTGRVYTLSKKEITTASDKFRMMTAE